MCVWEEDRERGKERVHIYELKGCCKRAWKRGEVERGRWIALCSVVLGRRGDWGWRLEIATGDQLIQSFKWLWENQSNQHTLSLRLAHTLPLSLGLAHTCTQSYIHNIFCGVEFTALLICFHVAVINLNATRTHTRTHMHAHTYTHWFLVWNLICLAHSWMTDMKLSVSHLNR